jgi:hypothetical protein
MLDLAMMMSSQIVVMIQVMIQVMTQVVTQVVILIRLVAMVLAVTRMVVAGTVLVMIRLMIQPATMTIQMILIRTMKQGKMTMRASGLRPNQVQTPEWSMSAHQRAMTQTVVLVKTMLCVRLRKRSRECVMVFLIGCCLSEVTFGTKVSVLGHCVVGLRVSQ